jgi:hypothetical protein
MIDSTASNYILEIKFDRATKTYRPYVNKNKDINKNNKKIQYFYDNL